MPRRLHEIMRNLLTKITKNVSTTGVGDIKDTLPTIIF